MPPRAKIIRQEVLVRLAVDADAARAAYEVYRIKGMSEWDILTRESQERWSRVAQAVLQHVKTTREVFGLAEECNSISLGVKES